MRLAIRNGARRPTRSTLTIGLTAAASFVIVAVSAFWLEPPSGHAELHSGDGGFSLYAETDQPIYQDLNSPDGRKDLPFDSDVDKLLAGIEIIGLRAQSGDDANCLNLYQPRQPRILGVPPALVKHDGFEWTATAATTQAERDNPWLLLDAMPQNGGDPAPIPVVLDAATATYSLHLNGVGAIYNITDSRGEQVPLRVVGLLQNSLFQGDLLIRESDLVRLFPETSGDRVFLIGPKPSGAAPPSRSPSASPSMGEGRGEGEVKHVRESLEAALGDYGFDAESTRHRLESFMAVQNTYLSTFQRLGGLGLLLGTIGLAVVQLRSVIERRGELALMRAVGFRRRRLAGMVLLENAALLIGGLAIGIVAALVAIMPQLLSGRATTPWLSLVATLGLVLAFGLAAGMLAARATLGAPLVPALRDE